MAGFTKLFSNILTSTIWQADDKTRLLWITMLAAADATGKVDGAVPGLAHLARITTEDCVRALVELCAPDKFSRTSKAEGRRIEEVPGGWRILNYGYYRNLGRSQDRTEYYRKYRAQRATAGNLLQRQRQRQSTEAETDRNTSPADKPPVEKPRTEKQQVRDRLWEALCHAFHLKVQTDSEKARVGKVVSELQIKQATPAQVGERLAAYYRTYPDSKPIGPEGLMRQWDALAAAKPIPLSQRAATPEELAAFYATNPRRPRTAAVIADDPPPPESFADDELKQQLAADESA